MPDVSEECRHIYARAGQSYDRILLSPDPPLGSVDHSARVLSVLSLS
jgi:hypothetical protein